MPLFGRKHKKPLGIYIHVPFCRSKCEYCDFYSLPCVDSDRMEQYRKAVCTHIREAGALAPQHLVDTVYFGGGTPSFFGADGMADILTAIRKAFSVAGDAEITFECNPDSVTDRLLRRLRSEGFNRVSMGVQSDNDELLKKLGRPHTYDQAVKAVERIRRFGYRNLSLDLMYGLPGQKQISWERTLENVLSLQPEHISCYGLKVEPGTPLYEYREFCDLADDDLQADMYLAAVDILKSYGYRQYEISNFCKKGQISRHNMKYWTGGEYLGFGPDASSDFGGRRFSIVRDLDAYVDGILNREQVLRDVQEVLPRERAGEYLMMRLRTVSGISQEEYEKQFLMPFAPLEAELLKCRERGLAVKVYDRWHLTPNGFLLSNDIISTLLMIQDQ